MGHDTRDAGTMPAQHYGDSTCCSGKGDLCPHKQGHAVVLVAATTKKLSIPPSATNLQLIPIRVGCDGSASGMAEPKWAIKKKTIVLSAPKDGR